MWYLLNELVETKCAHLIALQTSAHLTRMTFGPKRIILELYTGITFCLLSQGKASKMNYYLWTTSVMDGLSTSYKFNWSQLLYIFFLKISTNCIQCWQNRLSETQKKFKHNIEKCYSLVLYVRKYICSEYHEIVLQIDWVRESSTKGKNKAGAAAGGTAVAEKIELVATGKKVVIPEKRYRVFR